MVGGQGRGGGDGELMVGGPRNKKKLGPIRSDKGLGTLFELK